MVDSRRAGYAISVIVLASVAGLAGCGSGGAFPVASTTGVVLCEGRPVPGVTVFFEPLTDGQNALVGKQGIGFANDQGEFTISTYGDGDGAVVGKHRVRVGPPRMPPPGFSCDCVLNSEVDVQEIEITRGRNTVELVLTKKPARAAKTREEIEAEQDAREEARERARGG